MADISRTGRVMRGGLASFFMILVMTVIAVISLIPFYSMMVMGTYYINDLFTGIKMVPGNYVLQNLKTLFTVPIFKYYRNSFTAAAGSCVLCVLISSMCGYAIAKYQFRARKFLFRFVLFTLIVPTQLGLIAFMIEMKFLGLLGTLWPIILPNGASAFGVFWMTSFITEAIPNEVIESARIDGCNEYSIFFRISLPFMRSAVVTLALLSFLWSWNALLVPLVVLNKEALFTLPLGIKSLSSGFRNDYGAQILGLSVGTIPILVFFSFFSKNLISGLSAVAVKG
ncbi:MAG: carbohydrate ABC transporter permease [Treponema sp.]|jgi:multiple sugar transport system permease protein/cellobiose transport system permease protein|nr:carbohydrate ABC transporter permease [Treponema sp.]